LPLRFRYSKAENPSSLVLDLNVWNGFGEFVREKGKIDTGSTNTVIPEYVVHRLRLKKMGDSHVIGVQGPASIRNNYFVSVEIGSIKFGGLTVIAMERETVLIGRDLINLWRMELYGESETYTIEPWSTDPGDLYRPDRSGRSE